MLFARQYLLISIPQADAVNAWAQANMMTRSGFFESANPGEQYNLGLRSYQ